MLIYRAIIEGMIFSILFNILIFSIIKFNPRLELKSYPDVIKRQVPTQTKEEKKKLILIALPCTLLLLIFLAVSIVTAFHKTSANFWNVSVHVFIIIMICNLYDLVIMDWLIFSTITPKFLVIPGTEGNPAYKDYLYHLKGLIIGTIVSFVLAPTFGGIIYLILRTYSGS